MCHVPQCESARFTIGIKSKAPKARRSKYVQPSYCPHPVTTRVPLVAKICILKYTSTPANIHYIIIQPMHEHFDSIIADIDISNLTPNQKTAYDLATFSGQKEFSFFNRTYSTDLVEKEYTKFMPEIEFAQRQKLANGLVFKLFEYPSDFVVYASFLDERSAQNPCRHQKKACFCDNKCQICYNSFKKMPEKIVVFEPESPISTNSCAMFYRVRFIEYPANKFFSHLNYLPQFN